MPEFINATVDLRIWNIAQAVLSSILLIEWSVRFFCFPEPRKLDFFRRTLNVTDLIGSLSIVVELGVLLTSSAHSGFEVIELLRLFRLVRLAEMSGQVRSLTRALSKSRDAFVLMVAVYFIGETLSHSKAFDATWWAVVMMSTVGFGDVVPKTWAGKLVAGFGIIGYAKAAPTTTESARGVNQFANGGGGGQRTGILAKATSFLATFRSRENNDNILIISKIFGGVGPDVRSPLAPSKGEASPEKHHPYKTPIRQRKQTASRRFQSARRFLTSIQALEQLLNNVAPHFQPGSSPTSPLSLPNQQEYPAPRSALTEGLPGTNPGPIPASDSASAQVWIGTTGTQRDIGPGIGYASNAEDAIAEGETAVEFTIRRLVL
ncbi:hypothetical protein BJ742DRAFT_767066 [Cladochytrium replicatum]|nr:hypothetical protein BJ742DRAFT_767066 [Cladochytrium replicatum]